MTPLPRLNAGESAIRCQSTHRSPSEPPTAAGGIRSCPRRISPRAVDESGNNRVRFQLGATFAAIGRIDDAIRELEIAARPAHGHNSRMEAYLGYAYAAAGRTVDARAVLKELDAHRHDQYVSAFGIALIDDALGEKEPAVAALQRACEDHAVEFAQVAQYPPFRAIATEPAFQKVMQQVGLPR